VFAPETGRFLLPTLLLLLVLSALVAVGSLPHSYIFLVILAIGFSFWAFFASFYRDPRRTPGRGIVSPADGRVLEIERADDRVRIAVFMGLSDVHINRFPVSGRVEAIDDSGEGYRPAYLPDARHNVQRRYTLSTDLGKVEVVQMTGLVAKRIISFVGVGDAREKGERLGMIVLGSRVDLVLPADRVRVSVEVGDRVRAGESSLARERS